MLLRVSRGFHCNSKLYRSPLKNAQVFEDEGIISKRRSTMSEAGSGIKLRETSILYPLHSTATLSIGRDSRNVTVSSVGPPESSIVRPLSARTVSRYVMDGPESSLTTSPSVVGSGMDNLSGMGSFNNSQSRV